MSSSLTIAVTHAISFLTRPLVGKYSHSTIDRLHTALEAQLAAHYLPTWVEADPSYGSSARALTLAPEVIPPSAIWRSGIAAGVAWSDWIAALGGFEFDLFVDPGRVAFQIGAWAESLSGLHIIWQVDPSSRKHKTLAQSIVDDEENAIFNMIDMEVSAPSWLTPILDRFPSVPPSISSSPAVGIPSLSVALPLTRSSSRASSSSSSGFSFSSGESDSASSMSTPSSCRSSLDLPPVTFVPKAKEHAIRHRSRRSRGRVQDVFVDAAKKEVTNYDGGKTTVLTGGVMLGGPAPSAASKPKNDWRRPRVPARW